MDELGDLSIISVAGHTILILKTDICNVLGKFYFLLAIDLLYNCIVSFIEVTTVIYEFLQSLNPATCSLSNQAFIFMVLQI